MMTSYPATCTTFTSTEVTWGVLIPYPPYTVIIDTGISNDYAIPEPPPSEDQRHNRKFQAQMFREFLAYVCKSRISYLLIHPRHQPEPPLQHCNTATVRSRLSPQREWKMKDWKQAQ
jgi:hypothetical protein